MNQKPKRIAVDISSIRDWCGTPVGIVRVVVEVTRYAIEQSETYDCTFFCFSKDKRKLIILSRKKVVRILQRMESRKQRKNFCIRAIGKIKKLLRTSDLPLLFESQKKQAGNFLEGRTVISVGFDWDMSNYPLLIQIKKKYPFRFVAFFHDAIYFFHPEWCPDPKFPSLFRNFFLDLVSLADIVICNSVHTKMQYFEMSKRLDCNPPVAFSVLLGGNDNYKEKNIDNVDHLEILGIRKPFVLYVSTIEPRKNHIVLLHIWDQLVANYSPNIPDLVFVGNLRVGSESLFTYIDSHPYLKGKIKFLSQIPDIQLSSLYQETLFTVFPSLDEGYGLGASESLQYGKACIISSCPALIEATQGLMPIIPVNDLNRWVEVVSRCINDQGYLCSLEELIKNKYAFRSWNTFDKEFFQHLF